MGLAGRGNAGPGAAEVFTGNALVAPHIQGEGIPTAQVLDIDNHGSLGLFGLGAGAGTGIHAATAARAVQQRNTVGRHLEEVVFDAFLEGHIVVGQLGAAAVVVEDEVLGQAEDVVTVLEVLVLDAGEGFAAGHLCAGPVAAVVVHVTPLVQCDGVPTGLVVHPHAHAVVLGDDRSAAFRGIRGLGYAVGRHQEEVILDTLCEGDVVVGQLGTAVVIVEDEVLAKAEDVVTILEVLVLLVTQGDGAAHLCAGPVAAVVVHVAPLVQGDGIPTGLVDDVDAYAVVVGQHNLALVGVHRQEVFLPLVGIDVGPFTGADVEGVRNGLVARGTLVTLLHVIEGEALGQGVAALELGGIQIDAPFGGDGLGVGH